MDVSACDWWVCLHTSESYALCAVPAQVSKLLAEKRDLVARTQRDLPAEMKKLRQLQRENAEVLVCVCACVRVHVCVRALYICACMNINAPVILTLMFAVAYSPPPVRVCVCVYTAAAEGWPVDLGTARESGQNVRVEH